MLEGPILLPLDGSEFSERIIPYARQVARGLLAKITVLVVTDDEGAGGARGHLLKDPSGQAVAAEEYVASVAREMSRHGVQADTAIAQGKAAQEIVRYSEEHGFGLVAMATHGRSGPGRWVYGSTADRVLHTTQLPLLLVRPNPDLARPAEDRHTSVLAPLDGSELAEKVLDGVAALAQRLALAVTLLRVVPTPALALGGVEPRAADAKMFDYAAEEAHRYLQEKAEALKRKGLRVATRMTQGHAATSIIDTADVMGGSLIAMTTHGLTGVGRWVLGSVADRVLRASHRPILLLR